MGPTASGKSRLAVAVAADEGDVEIVSVDSMAVYRGMDIGTATPSAEDRRQVPHHMIDILDPWEDCTVSLFQEAALQAMGEVIARGRVPLLVGGSGLYHRAVIDVLEIPGQFPEIRSRLEAEAAEGGLAEMMNRLRSGDPIAAERIEPGNERRIVRALEVVEGTGRQFSSFGPGLESYGPADVLQVGISPGGDVLRSSAERRVDEWINGGFLDEVERLAAEPRDLSRTAAQAIGYRELLDHLVGDLTIEEAVIETVRRTKSLARRQLAWFKRDPRVSWSESPDEAAAGLRKTIAEVRRSIEVRD